MFHGTKPEIVPTIQEHGFDERVCSLAGMYGAGIYFAEACSKSDQYVTTADTGQQRTRRFYMFLGRVCLGYPHHTARSMPNTRRPPEMTQHIPGRPFDSILADVGATKYREFIVYDKAQTYPEYLIEFTRQ